MARRGGGDEALKVVGAVAVGALLLWLISGRGKNNSLFIPDAIEDRIDRLVEVFNGAFGQRWVDAGLNALQAHIERTMPQLAALVNAVYWVEKQYRFYPNAGATKKAAILAAA
jgi:hypothetical protein